MRREGYLLGNHHYFHLKDNAGQERDFHFHEFDKIVILLSGNVTYAVENQLYPLNPWDVLLVTHHCIHKAVIDRREYYQRIILYLDGQYFDRCLPEAHLMESFDRADKHSCYRFTPGEAERRELQDILNRYEALDGDGRPGSDTLRELVVMSLLVHVGRIVSRENAISGTPDGNCDDKIRKILSYINENFTQPLTVDMLAEQLFLSRYHFMRLFKSQTGSTVHAYIRQKRLLHAARLIRAGTPVIRAAEEAGFSDYSTFHRAFRETFGTAPGELRK